MSAGVAGAGSDYEIIPGLFDIVSGFYRDNGLSFVAIFGGVVGCANDSV